MGLLDRLAGVIQLGFWIPFEGLLGRSAGALRAPFFIKDAPPFLFEGFMGLREGVICFFVYV